MPDANDAIARVQGSSRLVPSKNRDIPAWVRSVVGVEARSLRRRAIWVIWGA
jgi:hypothetical protein